MKHLLVGAVVAASIVLSSLDGSTGVANAHPCTPEPVCHEFDWAIPHYDAFDRHGITYLYQQEGIPLIDRADGLCDGRYTTAEVRDEFNLTDTEIRKVVEAMADVCESW